MTKKALTELPPNGSMVVELDNATSKDNVVRFLKDNNADVTVTEERGLFRLAVTKRSDELGSPDAASYCQTPRQPHVICIRSNRMGAGAEELGEILMKAFVNTIREVSPRPSAVVLYNSGIFLAVAGSPVIEALKELEGMGVSVLVCGTCTNYYDKTDDVAVGTVSNMYDILETLTTAGHVVCP
jgi:selenium metabolism protein YedF